MADPIAGLVIALMILVLKDAARDMLLRVMDGVDPGTAAAAETVLAKVPGVEGVGAVRVRWIGHRLHAEAKVVVDEARTIGDAHEIAERARHALLHDVPHLVGDHPRRSVRPRWRRPSREPGSPSGLTHHRA